MSLLLLVSSLSPQPGSCEVVLTDAEAQEIMGALEESRKDLADAQVLSQGLQNQLDALRSESERLRIYYEEQSKGQRRLTTVMVAVAASCGVVAGLAIGSLMPR